MGTESKRSQSNGINAVLVRRPAPAVNKICKAERTMSLRNSGVVLGLICGI